MQAHGVILEGTREVADTTQCVHCGGHFVMVKGSGVTRGFCMCCGGITCGKRECSTRCVPLEAQLEHLEGKRNRWSTD